MPDPFTMTTGIGKGLYSVSSPLLDELSPQHYKELLRVLADASGGSFEITNDPNVTKGADIVYAKSWCSLGSWGDTAGESFKKLELRDWQVTPESLGAGARLSLIHI